MERKSDRILVGKTEICAFAGIGQRLFPDLLQRGFPAVYWGGKWRAHADNVEEWMRSATIPSGPQSDIAEQEQEQEQEQDVN